MQDMNNYLCEELENVRRNQAKILDMKISFENIINRNDHSEGGLLEPEDKVEVVDH